MINLRVEKEERIDSSQLKPWQQFVLFLRLQRYVLPYWDKLIARLLCTQAAGMLVLIPPVLTVTLIDDVFPAGDIPALIELGLLSIGALTLSHVLLYLGGIPTNFQTAWVVPESILGNYMIARVMLDMKMRYYRHLQQLSVRFFHSRPIGEHMFRGSLDLDDAALLSSESIPLIASTLQRIIMTSYLLTRLGGNLFLFVLVYLAIFFTLKQIFVTIYRRMDRGFRQENAQLEAVTREILASGKVIKGYAREKTAHRWYGAQALRMVRMLFRREVFMFFDMHITSNAFTICLPLFSIYFGLMVLSGENTLGEYLSASSLLFLLLTPLQEIISLYQLVRQRLVPGERMVETLGVAPDIVDAPGAQEVKHVEGAVELRNVTFGYHKETPVLKGVSLRVNPGEKVALVGEIGAGKTTLTNLLFRLYEPQAGSVCIDGRDIRDYTQASLRQHMAIVTQQINTFTESIERNILYGRPLAPREDVVEAARLACVEEFVLPLPEQYETVLAEGGSLSGGQKQRICIARALVRNPSILVLDEATSALDPVTEKKVIEGIDEAFADRTRIIVAHNLLSAKTADRIYVIARGEVVESGTHETLMAANGAYAELWRSDNKDANGNEG